MPSGLSHINMDPQGFMALQRDIVAYQAPATADFFTSATSGGAVGDFDCSASVVGDSVFLSTNAALPLMVGRRPTFRMHDAGTGLACTVRITGKRFGKVVVQNIVGVNDTSVAGTRVIDEVTSIKIISISSPGAGDTIEVGIDGAWAGLLKPIKSFRDLNVVQRRDGTSATVTIKGKATFTAAMVNVQDSAIDLEAISSAIVAADFWQIEYFANGSSQAFIDRSGRRFG